MNLSERKDAFVQLGSSIIGLSEEEKEELFWRAENNNSWFTAASTATALAAIASMLEASKLDKWLKGYTIPESVKPRSIGILMAGNIPAVGFHDLMVVLLSGNRACVKLSSADAVLMRWIIGKLIAIDSRWDALITVEEMLKKKDAYIATGSDNSARYFSYYFGKYPNVIRQNRTSVAILSGKETKEELTELGKDIFRYFGLGCRNVSKIYVQSKDQLQELLAVLERDAKVGEHHKYRNNYDYNKSIYLVNLEEHLDNGFLLLKESNELVSPIAVLYYELYENKPELEKRIDLIQDRIQCVVSSPDYWKGAIPFGGTQTPDPWDYADQVDTLQFLIDLG